MARLQKYVQKSIGQDYNILKQEQKHTCFSLPFFFKKPTNSPPQVQGAGSLAWVWERRSQRRSGGGASAGFQGWKPWGGV